MYCHARLYSGSGGLSQVLMLVRQAISLALLVCLKIIINVVLNGVGDREAKGGQEEKAQGLRSREVRAKVTAWH